jgi:hypothetical protein
VPEFFDYHPHNGVLETFDWDETNQRAIIHHKSDLEMFFARNAEARNTGACDKGLMEGGKEFHFYASLTPIVQIELRQKGIDIYSKDPTMIRRMFAEINKNYPYCKMTAKHHE